MVGFSFIAQPDAKKYNFYSLLFIYTMQGIGRSSFEGPLKALFIDFFSYEKEGAMASIIVVSGFSGAIGFFGVETLEILTVETIILLSSFLAAVGVLAAYSIHEREQRIEGEN